MSGGLRDLASWALRGGAGNANNNDNPEEGGDAAEEAGGQALAPSETATTEVPMTAEELRAQRLARMEELQQRQKQQEQEQQQQSMQIDDGEATTQQPEPMEIDEEPPLKKEPAAAKKKETSPKNNSADNSTKKAKSDHPERSGSSSSLKDPAKLFQRQKEALLKKVLGIVLESKQLDNSIKNKAVYVDTGSTEISPATVAEILATRLSLPVDNFNDPSSSRVIPYAGLCYHRAREEIKSLQSQLSNSKKAANSAEPLLEILQEMQRQLVSYAATCLQEPDLFPSMAQDAPLQLAQCLLNPQTVNLTLGGSQSSFYHSLIQELKQQSETALRSTVSTIVEHYGQLLQKCDSVVEAGAADAPAVSIVAALTALCSHKSVAAIVTELPTFLLPAAGTPEAAQIIRPSMPTGANPLQQLLASSGELYRPYIKRSGPGLERHTVLGQCLRLGAPCRSNAAFSPDPAVLWHQTPAAVAAATHTQRQSLQHYQAECYQLVRNLLKTNGKTAVLQWFTDALLVNRGAAALRPDLTKVSGRNLRLNVSVLLLKLCEPVTHSSGGSKQGLVDPGFVSCAAAHGGVFDVTGDHNEAVPRLGGAEAVPENVEYHPPNTFIPQIFFLAARSLHFGIVPLLEHHESLLRNISHFHYELSNSGRDVRSDPRFASLLSRQRTDEVALFQEEMMEPTLRFCNFEAKVLFDMDDDTLRTMPEEFVSDVCDILLGAAIQCPKQLGGIEYRYVFKLVVKLLSPKYASMVRNYNLRAQLGDTLYEVFLPRTTNSRRDDVPASVACDPLAGGQTYLLSDASAQETLAPSLLLLYGEVEHTGYYDKMSHRAKIASLIKYLWESKEHRPAFRRITQNKVSFIKFANGIMNETNTLIATVMQKLPEIREAQEKMKDTEAWGRLSQEEQEQISSRLEDSERDVKSSLPLCNKTLQMFGYLSTDPDIRSLFLLEELCSRLVTMLLHVMTKLVGSKGLDLKVDNPEQYDFRPKEMLRDLCAIFALFAGSPVFQTECANARCNVSMLRKAVHTCERLNLLTGESMEAFQSLPDAVQAAAKRVAIEDELLSDAPDEYMDALLLTFMKDPVKLPSGHIVDRSTITQHLLNDPTDPFNRAPLKIEDVEPATDLKERMDQWVADKLAARDS